MKKILFVLLIGVAVRLLMFQGELWLDEVWSIRNIQELSGLSEILSLRTDNNHLLNSAYIYVVQESFNPLVYRALSFLFSIAALLLVCFIAIQQKEKAILLLLIGASFPLALFCTEARGYSGVILAGVLYYLLLKKDRKLSLSFICDLSAVTILGLLSHASFFLLIAAFLLWKIYQSPPKAFVLFTPSIIIALGYWFSYVRHLPQGSGPQYSWFEVIIETLGIALGAPTPQGEGMTMLLLIAVALLAVALILCEIFVLWKKEDSRWVLFLSGIVLVPACVLIFWEPRVLYVRYFLAPMLLFYFLLASFFSRLIDRDMGGKIISIVLLLLFVIGNGLHLFRFSKYQRGSYQPVIMYFAENPQVENYTADHSFRHPMMMSYASKAMGLEAPLFYNIENLGDVKPDSLLLHSLKVGQVPSFPKELSESDYELKKVIPHTALSGWTLYLYVAR